MRAWRWMAFGGLSSLWLVLASVAQAQPEVLLEPARVVTEPTPPPPMPEQTSIAWNGSELLVLWRDPCCADRLFARRLDASGAVISAPFDFAVPASFGIVAVDGFGRPTGVALPLVLPATAVSPRSVACGAASAVFFVEEATFLRGRALGSGASGEIWSIGRSALGFAVTGDAGTQAIAWVSDAGRLSLTLLDAQCRPRETRELVSVGGLFRVMVAMQGEVAAVAYVEVEGGPVRAIFSSPSGRSRAEKSRRAPG